MKYLVDAHLPRQLVYQLRQAGHDAIHTRELPLGDRSTDADILRVSMDEQRVVITKDADFVSSYVVKREPYKLLLISTGNIKNQDLLWLFEQNLPAIVEALEQSSYVEPSRTHLTIHQ
jgi:predicted nuclease of predicted toxin-antitoxin system